MFVFKSSHYQKIPFTCRTQSIKPSKPYLFFSKSNHPSLSTQGSPVLRVQSPLIPGGGGTSVQSRPREREVKGRARQSSGGLEAAPECSSRSSGAAPLQGV